MKYWFNVTTGKVETDDNRSKAAHLLGPYDSIEAAAAALETVRQRNEKWDEEDSW